MEQFPNIGAPDWGLASEDPETQVSETEFGDGYVLRQPKGINYIRDVWSPSWSSLEQEVAEATFAWLRVRKNLKAFKWVHPVSGEVVQVICTAVSLTYQDFNDTQLNASFKRDFNPV